MLWNTQSCLLLGRELILANLVSDVYGSSTHVEQEKGCPYPALATPQQRECLLVESWESLSLADTSTLVAGRILVADASVWRPILVEVPVCGENEQSRVQGQHSRQSFRSLLSFRSSRGISVTSGWMEVAGLKSLGRCCTAKSKQHLRHKQRMMIPEWNQRSLSYVSDTLVTRCQWPPILFPVSITSKGQINEGCLLCNG